MDWTSLISVALGGALAIGGGALQQRRTAKRADDEWVRNLRFGACVRVLSGYQSFTDALFWRSDDWDPYDHGPRPDPLPNLGEADNMFQTAVDELQILGPAEVASAAADLHAAAEHYRGSVAEGPYRDWGRHRKLKHRFLVAAIRATGTQVDPPEEFDWKAWRERFKALDEK